MKKYSRIIIGRIGAPHGVRGEVRIVPLTDFPNRFEGLTRAYLDDNGVVEFERVRYHQQFVIAKLKNFDSREAVDQIKNKLLRVDRSEVPPLADGEYYSFDIIGLQVSTEEGESLGQIVNIIKTGSNDVYVARAADGKETLIPALKKVVTAIDLQAGTMMVRLQEGMD